jgi:hypothetical protein
LRTVTSATAATGKTTEIILATYFLNNQQSIEREEILEEILESKANIVFIIEPKAFQRDSDTKYFGLFYHLLY